MHRSILLFALLAAALIGCKKPQTAPDPPPEVEKQTAPATQTDPPTKRIVLFIGDGMGIGQITAAGYAKGAPVGFVDMPYAGLMTTHEYEFLTTDSAASATAMSTGRKTHFEGVSVVPGTTEENETDPANHMQTLMQLASEHGLRTGMVATSRITHATPAAFGANRYHRHQYEGIAEDYANGELDVLIGAGWRNFDDRSDGVNLFDKMKADGWSIAKTPAELDAVPPDALRVAALMHPKDMPFLVDEDERAMQLPEMVSRAIDLLDRGDPEGWVLMVEGSFVDWCGHNLDAACAAVETLDLDAAVSRARSYASKRDDTLVVVTADHETAGLAVMDPYYSDRFSKILGGEAKATEMVALPDGDDAPPPFQHIEIGASDPTLKTEPLPGKKIWGMEIPVDGRASLIHGYFSLASRPYWKQDGRFYGAHSPSPVTIHAEGPGAAFVTAARDNADLGQAIRELVVRGAHGKGGETRATRKAPPKNVILMIGDGMGLSPIGGAYYWNGGLDMFGIAEFGLVTTHAVDYLVNDSAASATAMATGFRTKKKAVGNVWKDGKMQPSTSVLERAESLGKATGLISTTPITHATPAAFYAHHDRRYDTGPIVADLIALTDRVEGSDGIEVLLAGGAKDLDQEARRALTTKGYTITNDWPVIAEGNVIATLAEDGLAEATVRMNDNDPSTPTLREMTEFALERLQTDDDGFFLMVEGGQIDWRLHEGRKDASTFAEVVDFDDAVTAAREFAKQHGDTLVIVTADHDHTMTLLDNHYAFESGRCGAAEQCGGPDDYELIPIKPHGIRHGEGLSNAELQGEWAPPALIVQYAWPIQVAQQQVDIRTSHSANMVPIFAEGPWAHRFRGYLDQPEIGQTLHEWLNEE